MLEITTVAKTRLALEKFTLNSWVNRVLSGDMLRTAGHRCMRIDSRSTIAWITRHKVLEEIQKRKNKFEQEWATLTRRRGDNRNAIAAKTKQIREVVPNTIRDVIRRVCGTKPNAKSSAERRDESGFGFGASPRASTLESRLFSPILTNLAGLQSCSTSQYQCKIVSVLFLDC